MNSFKNCPINKDIFILASGESHKILNNYELNKIKEKTFLISLNFVNIITPHARIWSDVNITEWLEDKEKDCIYITRLKAFSPRISSTIVNDIDYWFDVEKDKLDPNHKWTLYWLLQLIHKYHNDKKVYILGMDCVDNFMTKYSKGEIIGKADKKNNCMEIPCVFEIKNKADPSFFKNMYNCNRKSMVKVIKYFNYIDLIDE